MQQKITSRVEKYRGSKDHKIINWKEAGLLKPSVVRVNKVIKILPESVLKILGHLTKEDIWAIQRILKEE